MDIRGTFGYIIGANLTPAQKLIALELVRRLPPGERQTSVNWADVARTVGVAPNCVHRARPVLADVGFMEHDKHGYRITYELREDAAR